jgi:streptomycin 6-kinase
MTRAGHASLPIPEGLARASRGDCERETWLARLPQTVAACVERWALTLGPPYASGSCAWVAPAATRAGEPAVLKIGLPHFEGEQEIAGLRFWAGEATVRLLDADESANAMLLERCVDGTPLATRPEEEQDAVIAGVLQCLWRRPIEPHPFRPLAAMARHWTDAALAQAASWTDPGLVRAGLELFESLARPAPTDVLLATDLHAGNVLTARRRPWLAIDPKPFVGDPAYDATQHLLNCTARLRGDPRGTVHRVADCFGLDRERVRLWTFARLAAEPGADWPVPAALLA